MHRYQDKVQSQQGSSSYIALAATGADAISQALGLFPCVRSVTVKAVRTRILG